MSFFIARLKNDPLVDEFLEETRERGSQALIEISVQSVKKAFYTYWVNIAVPKMPPIYLLGFLFFGLSFIFKWNFFIYLGSLFLLFYVVFWRGFHIYAFKRGLKKKGYTGSIEILSTESGLLEVYFR